MTKKTALNILILVIVSALMIVGYFLFFKKDPATTTNQNNNMPVASNFFPESENNPANNQNNQNNNQNNATQKIPKLRQISENPVAGFFLFSTQSTTTVPVLALEDGGETEEVVFEDITNYVFVNRSNGNVFKTTSKTLNKDRVTNTTIPKVYEALFVDENNIVFRYLDNESGSIVSSFVKLKEKEQNASTTAVLADEFLEPETRMLPSNIQNVLVSEDLVFYTFANEYSPLVGNIFGIATPETESNVFQSDINFINVAWSNDNNLFFGTKPSINSDNFLFKYNINSGTYSKILSADKGFSFLPNPTNGSVLYSELSGSKISAFVKSGEGSSEESVDINTSVGDKCVWSNTQENIVYCAEPTNSFGIKTLIDWYQGETSFEDSLQKIDIVSGEKTKIEGLGEGFDIIKMKVSEKDEFLVFVNKKDLSLWSLDITN